MSDPMPSVTPPPLPEPAPGAAAPTGLPRSERLRLVAEIGVMIAVGVLPDLAGALYAHQAVGAPTLLSTGHLVRIVLRSTSVCAVLLYIMWRTGEGANAFGLVKPRIGLDLGIGVGVAVVALVASFVVTGVAHSFREVWRSASQVMPSRAGLGPVGLLLSVRVLNSFAEELALWGFLSTRIRRLSGSAALAVLAPALLFASYHVYQSSTAVVAILVTGLIHGTCFRITGRLWPLVVAHTLENLFAMVQYL